MLILRLKIKWKILKERKSLLYIKTITSFYESKMCDIDKVEDEKIKLIQKKNLKEMDEFIMNPDFTSQDVFKKHSEFIFTNSNEPMSADTVEKLEEK